MDGEIVGRVAERSALEQRFDGAAERGWACILAGSPGIGKTTIWRYGIGLAAARGFRVLTSRSAEAEATFSYAALGDLLAPVLSDVGAEIPAPQRRSLEVALLRVEDSPGSADRRAVALATFEALRGLSARGHVLLALDDVQWLDRASAAAVSFALRRLLDEAVFVLATLRKAPGLTDRLELAGTYGRHATVHEVGPLEPRALTTIVREAMGDDVPRPSLVRVVETAKGNPLAALEIARALRLRGSAAEPGEPLPVPDDLSSLLRARIAPLPRATRLALLVVAAATRPTVGMVEEVAVGGVGALAPAEDAGIVHVGHGEVAFAHPLLASVVYRSARSADRRSTHRRLADAVADPEERARHLALASSRPDATVAEVLEGAAAHAFRRGAPDAAAELGDLSVGATPDHDDDDARRRGLVAAEYRFVAGDAAGARRLGERCVASAPAGAERAAALYLLSKFAWNDVSQLRPILRQAHEEAPSGSILLAGILADRGWVEILGGRLGEASALARRAIALAERTGEPEPLSLGLLTAAYAGFLRGKDVTAMLERAFALERRFEGPPGVSYTLTSARNTSGAQLMWRGELDRAREVLRDYYDELVEQGQYLTLWEGLIYLSELEIRAGHFRRAHAYASELLEILREAGYEGARETGLWTSALAEAHLGIVEDSREHASAGLELAKRHGDLFHVITNRSVLGFLELSLGAHAEAVRALQPLPDLLATRGIEDPTVYPFVPDLVEGLVGVGQIDEAIRVLGPFERRGRRLDRPLAIATATRSRALIVAARGDPERAMALLDRAEREQARLGHPFEAARTSLVVGEVRKRAKRKRDARLALERARRAFEELEAPLWAARAEDSLRRISGRVSSSGLTPTERRIVELAADGMTNRQIADALFISVKTVESNLSRAYAKLGVGSRRELSAHLGATGANRGRLPQT